jgi:hypothetical protein
MIDRREVMRTARAMLVLAFVAIGITAITLGVSRWNKWFSNDEPRNVIQPHR